MAANRRSTRSSLISQGQSRRGSATEDMMELSLTRAPLRRGSDDEPDDGCPTPSHTPRLALGNGSNRARLWENAWDEAADALWFPARQLGCHDRSTDTCGLNEAIRS